MSKINVYFKILIRLLRYCSPTNCILRATDEIASTLDLRYFTKQQWMAMVNIVVSVVSIPMIE